MHEDFRIAGQRPDSTLLAELSQTNEQGRWVSTIIRDWMRGKEQFTRQTSGSTGKPKEITIPRQWMERSAEASAKALGLVSGDKALLCIPAQYIGGTMMVVRAMHLGLDLHLMEPRIALSTTERFDFSAMIPPQVDSLLERSADISAYGTIIIGGAAISTGTASQLRAIDQPIYATYGMTETVSHIALKKVSQDPQDELFHTLDGVQIAQDEEGALALNIAMFDGLSIQTRDRVEIIDERRFRWLGRLDHVINSGGLKIQPEAIESRLSPFIPFPFIIAPLSDERWGQKAVLIVETTERFSPSPKLMRVIEDLGPKGPKAIFSVIRIPQSASGKYLRDLSSMELTELVSLD